MKKTQFWVISQKVTQEVNLAEKLTYYTTIVIDVSRYPERELT